MYVHIFILRICARRRRCLRGFRWYSYFVYSSGAVSGIWDKQMTPAVASERSIFSKNHDYNTYIKSFPCRGEHIRTYISGYRCTQWQKTTNRHTHIHTHTHTHARTHARAHARDSHSDDIKQSRLFEAMKLNRYNKTYTHAKPLNIKHMR